MHPSTTAPTATIVATSHAPTTTTHAMTGFSAFSNRLCTIQWPATFKPIGIEKFDGESDPKTWLRTYSITVRAANGNNDIMAAYFPVMMGRQALN